MIPLVLLLIAKRCAQDLVAVTNAVLKTKEKTNKSKQRSVAFQRNYHSLSLVSY